MDGFSQAAEKLRAATWERCRAMLARMAGLTLTAFVKQRAASMPAEHQRADWQHKRLQPQDQGMD
jgi:hypothetical protein